MAKKKLNHYVPRVLLNNWKIDHDERKGVWTLKAGCKNSKFYTSEGKKAYSFAISNYLYVPLVNGKRVYHVEDWFSINEGSLGTALKNIIERTNSSIFKERKKFHNFKKGLISLEFRTLSIIEDHIEYLTNNPNEIDNISGAPNRDLNLAVLKNRVNMTTISSYEYDNLEMIAYFSPKENVMIGDNLVITFDGRKIIPISSSILLEIKKSNSIVPTFTYADLTDDMVQSFNFAVAQQSKYWLVSKNKDLLDSMQSELTEYTKQIPEIITNKYNFNGALIKDTDV